MYKPAKWLIVSTDADQPIIFLFATATGKASAVHTSDDPGGHQDYRQARRPGAPELPQRQPGLRGDECFERREREGMAAHKDLHEAEQPAEGVPLRPGVCLV